MNKNKLKFSNEAIVFISFILLVFILNLFMDKNFGDDLGFSLILTQETIAEFTVRHYYTWSSRNLIEIPLIIVTYLPTMVFRFINTFLIFLFTHSAIKISGLSGISGLVFGCFSTLTYSWFDLASAGWLTTFICMFWAYAVSCYSVHVAIDTIIYDKPSSKKTVLSTVLLVYAANLEIVAAYLLVVYVCLFFYSLFIVKKVHKLLYFHIGVIVINFAHILTAPGNAVRSEFTVAGFYPDYPMKSFLSRIYEGTYQALLSIFLNINVFIILLTVTIVFALICNYKFSFLKIVFITFGVILTVCTLILNFSHNYTFVKDWFYNNAQITVSNMNSPFPYIAFLLLCFLFILLIMCVYLCIGHTKQAFIAIVLMLAGLASAVSLGLTPSIAVSGSRAYTAFKFSLIIVNMLVFNSFYSKLSKGYKIIYITICSTLFMFSAFIVAEGFGLV